MFPVLRRKLGERAFSMIETMVVAGAVATIGGFGYQMVSDMNKNRSYNTAISGVSQARAKIIDAINGTQSWKVSLTENGINCVLNKTNCSAFAGSPTPVAIHDVAGTKLTDPSAANAGFDMAGSPCSGFSPAGSPTCPFRYEVTWQPICPVAGSCLNPQEKLVGTLKFEPGNSMKSLINLSKLSFQVLRGQSFASFNETCQSVGGTFDNNIRSCKLPLEGVCPPGQIVIGIDPTNNTKICRILWTGACPSGTVMVGTNEYGTPVCMTKTCPGGPKPPKCYADPSLCDIWDPKPDGGPVGDAGDGAVVDDPAWFGGDGGGDGGCGGGGDGGGGCK